MHVTVIPDVGPRISGVNQRILGYNNYIPFDLYIDGVKQTGLPENYS
jgi:hypothetical protein